MWTYCSLKISVNHEKYLTTYVFFFFNQKSFDFLRLIQNCCLKSQMSYKWNELSKPKQTTPCMISPFLQQLNAYLKHMLEIYLKIVFELTWCIFHSGLAPATEHKVTVTADSLSNNRQEKLSAFVIFKTPSGG